MSKLVICISGLSGAGKSTASKLLRRLHSFPFFEIGHALHAAAKKRGLDVVTYAKSLEATLGPCGPVMSLIPQLKKISENRDGLVVEGLLSPKDLQLISDAFKGDHIMLLTIKRGREARIRGVMNRRKMSPAKAEEWVKRQDQVRRNQFEIDALERISDRVIVNEFSDARALYLAAENALKSVLISRMLRGVIKKKQETTRKRPIQRRKR